MLLWQKLHRTLCKFSMTLNVSSDKKCPAGTRSLHWKMQNKGVWGTSQQAMFLYRRKHCLLALRTVKLPFQSSRVIFLGRSPAEEHLPGIIQAKECMKKKKHISEEQHYLCEIGLEKMPHGEIYGVAVPRFASWYPPSIWKAIWTFHSEKAENSYSNLGILLLCQT